MKKEEFNAKYKDKGGINQLSKFRSKAETLDNIARHFCISKERVRQWMSELFDERYSPREIRRERRIREITSYMLTHTIEQAETLYKGMNKRYFNEAVKRHNHGITK